MRFRGQLSFDLIVAIIVLVLAFQSANTIFEDISLTQEKVSLRAQAKQAAQSVSLGIASFSSLPESGGFEGSAELETPKVFAPSLLVSGCLVKLLNEEVEVNIAYMQGDEYEYITEHAPLNRKGVNFEKESFNCGEKIVLLLGETEPIEEECEITPFTIKCNTAEPGLSENCSLECNEDSSCSPESELVLLWSATGDCGGRKTSIFLLNNKLEWTEFATGVDVVDGEYAFPLSRLIETEGEIIDDGYVSKLFSFKFSGYEAPPAEPPEEPPAEPGECSFIPAGTTTCNDGMGTCSIACQSTENCSAASSIEFNWTPTGECNGETLKILFLEDDGTKTEKASGIPISEGEYGVLTLGDIGYGEVSAGEVGIDQGNLISRPSFDLQPGGNP